MPEHSISHIRRAMPRGRRLKLATAGALTAGALGVGALLAGPASADEDTWQTASGNSEGAAIDAAESNARATCSQLGYNETYILSSSISGSLEDSGQARYVATVRAECSLD